MSGRSYLPVRWKECSPTDDDIATAEEVIPWTRHGAISTALLAQMIGAIRLGGEIDQMNKARAAQELGRWDADFAAALTGIAARAGSLEGLAPGAPRDVVVEAMRIADAAEKARGERGKR